MKQFILLLSLICSLSVAGPASAERGGHSRDENSSQRDQERQRNENRRENDERANRDRDQLSREQREQLRRDISDHGREIYRDRRK